MVSTQPLQRTLKRPIVLSGIGLHSGKEVRLTLQPAQPGTGVVFVRADLPQRPEIPASFENVLNTKMATTLGIGKVTVGTVEHLLGALQGQGVDNVRVEVEGPEVPIFDGSALAFCEAIANAGLDTQLQPRPIVAIRRRVDLRVADKWAVVEPSPQFDLRVSIEWDHPVIGFQEFRFIKGTTPFEEVASARTFGFLRDVESLQRMGLARGGSLDNAIVLDDARVLNPNGLRKPDEFVRHKVLDALGDFKLAGFEFQGMFRLHRPGHELHCRLLCAIFSDPRNYEFVLAGSSRNEQSVGSTADAILTAVANASRVAAY